MGRESTVDALRYDEQGFSLIETLVALSLALIVMMPATAFFLHSMAATSLEQQRQVATVLANQTLELARAVPPQRLPDGRTASAVDVQLAAPTTARLDQAVLVKDGPNVAALLPLQDSSQRVANVDYSIRSFVGRCWRPKVEASACTATMSSSAVQMYRVTAAVSWVPGRGEKCGLDNGMCEVVASTLIDPTNTDPIFNVSG